MKLPTRSLVLIFSVVAVPATVNAQATDAQCSASATQATGYTPGQSTTSGPDGDRLAGAAKGAARARWWVAHKAISMTMRRMPCRTSIGRTRRRVAQLPAWQ